MTALVSFLVVLAASGTATGFVLNWLKDKQFLDHPNDRSSHMMPTPRGAGLALVPVILLAWLALAAIGHGRPGTPSVVFTALGLMAISWCDDRRGVPSVIRLAAHVLSAVVGVAVMPDGHPVFQGLFPVWLDHALAALIWVWFINLYNFMDGIDGLSGVETLALGFGLAALGSAGAAQAATIGAAGLAFLWWNWQPAKIFLGDSGSVPLGYLVGWLLLNVAAQGSWVSALILPAYYLADASLTLAVRLVRGEKFWTAHRTHFYQRAVQGGASHAAVAKLVLGGDIILVGLALLALHHPWIGGSGALIVVILVLGTLQGRADRPIVR